MNKIFKRTVLALIVGGVLLVLAAGSFLFLMKPSPVFIAMQADSAANAGTWEDDPKNWHRAFNEDLPEGVEVVHSSYWRSGHFTYEFVYYFEVKATPEWRDSFLKKRGLQAVLPSEAWGFRDIHQSDDIPVWYVPEQVKNYEVWDKPGYHGSVYINKITGHIYFHDAQL